jgi:hypothetical protein
MENDDIKIKNTLSYWTIPLVIYNDKFNKDLLKIFNPILEKWNCYIISKKTHWHILETVIKSKETFWFSYDWNLLRTQCAQSIE